jgi:hypothetical protein
MPTEFFTMQSMLTLAGATGATFVVANGLQRAFDFSPKWLALAIAEAISLVGVFTSISDGESWGFSDLFVGVINGFLIYCTAAGGTHMLGSDGPSEAIARGAADAAQPHAGSKRRFLSPWF